MVAVNASRAIVLYLAWLGTLVGALVAMMAEVSPVRLSFIRPDTLFVAFTEAQVFFALLVWPFFVPWLGSGAPLGGAARHLREILVLLAFSFPLALMCANVSSAGAGTILRSQLLVAALAAFAAALGAPGGRGTAPWYVGGILALSAGPPFLHFLVGVLGRGPDLSFASWVSPFWGAARVAEGASLATAAFFGGGALVAFRLLRGEVDGPPVAQ